MTGVVLSSGNPGSIPISHAVYVGFACSHVTRWVSPDTLVSSHILKTQLVGHLAAVHCLWCVGEWVGTDGV